MSAISIQDQLAGRIEAIERKHATISSKLEVRSSKKRHGGTEARKHEGNEEKTVVPISDFPFLILPGVLSTGLEEIDRVLGNGLHAGVHEWYLTSQPRSHEATKLRSTEVRRQSVPLCLFVHLAWRALEANPSRRIIWVGKKCFPYPAVLVRDAGRDLRLLQRSLFVQAESPVERVWVADLAVRCGLAGAVIADGSSLDMAATRRLQLAARSRGVFVFLARPPQDLDKLSAASTRWMVRTARYEGTEVRATEEEVRTRHEGKLPNYQITKLLNPLWSLELLRCKGMQPSTSRPVWLVEWNRAANVIGVHTPVCDSFEQQATRQQGNKAARKSG